jgi:hypothetical protein
MFTESTESWKMETINQLQEVVDGLNESTKTANTIEDVNAALEAGDTKAFFDEKTNRFGIKHDGAFDNQEEKDNMKKASSIVTKIFECVKGMVQMKS